MSLFDYAYKRLKPLFTPQALWAMYPESFLWEWSSHIYVHTVCTARLNTLKALQTIVENRGSHLDYDNYFHDSLDLRIKYRIFETLMLS